MMRRLRDLSYRIKVPLALSMVIIFVAAMVTALLGARIYADARSDLLVNAESPGKTLAGDQYTFQAPRSVQFSVKADF